MPSEKFKRFLSNESRMSLREAKRICENAGYTVTESEDNVKYAVIRLGGSIGTKPTVDQSDVFDNKEDAKEKAKSLNKILSPGDKKFYGVKYTVIELTPRNIQKYNLKVNLNESEYTVQPRTKEELQEIIEETIEEKGPECDLNFIDTSKITDMSDLFWCSDFDGDISKWDTSNVINMSNMFNGAKSFNQPIGDWDVSKVKNMNGMFSGARRFNQDISGWDVSNVTDMSEMFREASFFNQSIGNWNVSNVKYMNGMFADAKSFNQPIGDWDVSMVRDMIGMFYRAKSFNQSIGNWDVSRVKYMHNMFSGASRFNQDISGWDVSRDKEMDDMFANSPLDHNPPSWYEE